MFQQAVSPISIQNSVRVPVSWLPHKFRNLKTLGPLFLMTFSLLTAHESLILCKLLPLFTFSKFVCLLCHYGIVAIILPHPPPAPTPAPLTKNSLSRYFETVTGKNLVWFRENRKKISQIINDYLYLPFFLLFLLREPETLQCYT
jgi:hypothetical protein